MFAAKLVSEIIDKTILIERNNKIGQIEPILITRQQEFRYLIIKNYKIIYWINLLENRIEIVNVFDCRQNPTKINL